MQTSILDLSALEQMTHDLADKKWALFDNIIPWTYGRELKSWALQEQQLGHLKPAEMGRGSERQRQEQTRGDFTLWLERPQWPMGFALLDALRDQLNQKLFLGLQNYECHLAYYPPGARYARHTDQARSHQPLLGERVVSFVLYLNEDWQAHQGGELVIYQGQRGEYDFSEQKILPLAGRLVIFDSQTLEHEVLPATRERWSLTGWMRRSRL